MKWRPRVDPKTLWGLLPVKRTVRICAFPDDYERLIAESHRESSSHPCILGTVPICGPTDDRPSGVGQPLSSDSRNFRCWFIRGSVVESKKFQAGSINVAKWSRVLTATLAAWTIALGKTSETFVPMLPH